MHEEPQTVEMHGSRLPDGTLLCEKAAGVLTMLIHARDAAKARMAIVRARTEGCKYVVLSACDGLGAAGREIWERSGSYMGPGGAVTSVMKEVGDYWRGQYDARLKPYLKHRFSHRT